MDGQDLDLRRKGPANDRRGDGPLRPEWRHPRLRARLDGRPGRIRPEGQPRGRLRHSRLHGRRFGRSLEKLLEIVEDLKARELHFVSLLEDVATSSAVDELVFHVFGAIAHFERRLIAERTRDGLAAARRRGRAPGRPPLPKAKAAALRRLVESGVTATAAARQLSIGQTTACCIMQELREAGDDDDGQVRAADVA